MIRVKSKGIGGMIVSSVSHSFIGNIKSILNTSINSKSMVGEGRKGKKKGMDVVYGREQNELF